MITSNRLDIVSVFDAIRLLGHDMDFEPRKPCTPTGALKGTIERLEVYRLRIANGEELYHANDEPLATMDGWVECVAFCRASIAETKRLKRLAAIENVRTQSDRQKIKNASSKRCRQRAREAEKDRLVTVRLRRSPLARHPDVLEPQ